MVPLAVMLAVAHPAEPSPAGPVPGAPDDLLEGFLAVWVDADALYAAVRSDAVPPARLTAPTPAGLAVLGLDEGVAREAVLQAVRGTPGLEYAALDATGSALLVRHPDLRALLDRPLGEGRVADAVSLYPVSAGLPGHGIAAPEGRLDLVNPYTARAVLALDGLEIGEVAPRDAVALRHLRPATWTVTWRLPNGTVLEERHATVVTGSAGDP